MEIEKRWTYIRDSYNRFKRKRKMSPGSSAPRKFLNVNFQNLISMERNKTSNVSSDSAVALISTEN